MITVIIARDIDRYLFDIILQYCQLRHVIYYGIIQ